MQKHWKLFYSPRNLIIFEAAARLVSFTGAAKEMNIRQPSVSAAIKQLEATLATQLFDRYHRRIELTEAGQKLYVAMSKSLSDIEYVADQITGWNEIESVTLNTSSAFSHYWMMPKIHALREAYPDIDLRLQISESEPDLNSGNISLAVRQGNGHWPGHHAVQIAEEIIYPVASPVVMERAAPLNRVEDMLKEQLIHLEEPVRKRASWADWFGYHQIEDSRIPTGLKFNDYALVLQAAMGGEGFAFGWDHIVRDLVAKNLLVAREDWAWHTGNGFYLVWSDSKKLSDKAEKLKDWMLQYA